LSSSSSKRPDQTCTPRHASISCTTTSTRAVSARTLQQMLAIGRALMSRPRLLLFDEPSLGLAPNIVEQVLKTISTIRDSGTTILLVEQNAYAALERCDYAYLLEQGRIVKSGKGAELISDPHVRTAYLGG
jgi:branched-chain amino acid transport system ATP-binding protein